MNHHRNQGCCSHSLISDIYLEICSQFHLAEVYQESFVSRWCMSPLTIYKGLRRLYNYDKSSSSADWELEPSSSWADLHHEAVRTLIGKDCLHRSHCKHDFTLIAGLLQAFYKQSHLQSTNCTNGPIPFD